MNAVLSRNAPRIDHRAIRARQQATWASADYAVTDNALQMVSEELCETVSLCQDQRVLDVAAGSCNASLAAARRWCDVTAIDPTTDLTERNGQHAEARSQGVRFVEGEAEALPFADQSFDAVVSAFGAMFALDQERAASEMIRVCRRGGYVGLANWTPDGFIGQLFNAMGTPQKRLASDISPFLWGTEERLEELFGVYGSITATRKRVAFRARSATEWARRFRGSLATDLLEQIGRFNRASDGTMLVQGEYLEVLIRRR